MDSTASQIKKPGKLALGALTVGALTAAALGSVPTAGASCASFFGIGSGGQCTSTLTSIAIAIGTNAEAHADGILGAAMTFGNSSNAIAMAGGLANTAITFGNNNLTSASGLGSLAVVAAAINQTVIAGIGGLASGNVGNVAVSLAGPEATETWATGIGNFSLNLAGSGLIKGDGVGLTTVNSVGLNADLRNAGVLNNITNISGNNTKISNDEGTGGIGNLGFNIIGSDNTLRSKGTLATVGAVGSSGQTVSQDGFGVNVAFGRRAIQSAAAKVPAPGTATGIVAAAAAADNPGDSSQKPRGTSRHRGHRSGG